MGWRKGGGLPKQRVVVVVVVVIGTKERGRKVSGRGGRKLGAVKQRGPEGITRGRGDGKGAAAPPTQVLSPLTQADRSLATLASLSVLCLHSEGNLGTITR